MKIEAITLNEKRYAFKNSFATSKETLSHRSILFLSIQTDTGLEATSECVAQDSTAYLPETREKAKASLENTLIPAMLGQEFIHPREIHSKLLELAPHSPMARATIDMAAWKILAQEKAQSLAELLGADPNKVIKKGIAIGLYPSIDQTIDQIRGAIDSGYERIKIKIQPQEEIQTLEAIRSALGTNLPLMIDANGSYTTRDIPLLKKLDAYTLMMIEQPFPKDAWDLHQALQAQIQTPICLDESLSDLSTVQKMRKSKAGKIVNLKPGRVGGFTESLAILNYCQEQQIPVWIGGMHESPLGRADNLALAAHPAVTLPGDLSDSQLVEA